MANIQVNDTNIECENGENLLKILEKNNISVPTLCHIKNLFPSGACRMCVVEVNSMKNLVPSCAFNVSDGLKIRTNSPRVVKARQTIIELLLASHPDDCLFCKRSTDCELQELAQQYGVSRRRFLKKTMSANMDLSSPSLVRDPNKCILCGKCVRVCEEIMGVGAIDFAERGSKSTVTTAFNMGLNASNCVSCGQCIMVCPTGALSEQDNIEDVLTALADSDKYVVVQHAPAVSVTIGEFFKMPPGTDVDGLLVAALKQIGFKKVFDTSFAADLTIMEEGSEFISRIKNAGQLPMFTSCSPAWVNFVEEFYPEFIPNLSSCKSPQQMLGALVKSFFAEKEKLDPKKIVSISIMPCVAKKREVTREQMTNEHGTADLDFVLTTRELARLIKKLGIDFSKLTPQKADQIMGERSTAGKLFGATGGVMEAALRSAHFLITGVELPELEFKALRGTQSLKEALVTIGSSQIKVAVVSGLGNARKLLDDIAKGLKTYHFVEVMSCPGGCIAGGGQPISTDPLKIKARMNALYEIDKNEKLRLSHHNQVIASLYKEYLGEPLGEKSHHLLHTSYKGRNESEE